MRKIPNMEPIRSNYKLLTYIFLSWLLEPLNIQPIGNMRMYCINLFVKPHSVFNHDFHTNLIAYSAIYNLNLGFKLFQN